MTQLVQCHFLNWFKHLNQKEEVFDDLGGEHQVFCYNYFINIIIYSNNQVLYQYHDKWRFYISNKIIIKCIGNHFFNMPNYISNSSKLYKLILIYIIDI